MAKPRVTLDPAPMSPVAEKHRGPLEDQLTSALQAATEEVDDDYAGETVEEVAAELLEQTKAGLHPDIAEGFAPDADDLHAVAEAIVHNHDQ